MFDVLQNKRLGYLRNEELNVEGHVILKANAV